MAFDEYLAERINRILLEAKVDFFSKKMMGGLVFMVDEKMACGVMYNKKKELDLIMVRIGEDAAKANKNKSGYHPMDFTGRPMRGYAWIDPDGYDTDEDLEFWIGLCLDYNPFAKSSKKKKKSK